MQIVVTKHLGNLVKFNELPKLIAKPSSMRELQRGVIDAARKTRTKVRRAVKEQMGVAAGSYQSYVVANTGLRASGPLSASIWASAKGGQITDFKGLRALSVTGRAAARANRGNSFKGTVRSQVWNNPRVFKRSFESNGGYFALIRANGAKSNSTMPKAFWTHGSRADQDRDSAGRFADTGAQKWRTRRLRGPAINKELDKGQTLATFMRYGPEELEAQTMKRLSRILKW